MARLIETVRRDAEAAGLRSKSWTYQQIADHFGVSRAAAHKMVQRAMLDILTEPAEAARQFELDKLDALEQGLLATLERKHYIVSHGRIVRDGEHGNLEDDGFIVTASLALLRFSESRRKLLGLDSPTKVDVSGGVRYEVVGVDMDKV